MFLNLLAFVDQPHLLLHLDCERQYKDLEVELDHKQVSKVKLLVDH